jgi:cobalt/nickel transport protein
MLLPQTASAKRGEAVTFMYQWGHPFEHQLFEAPAPERLIVVSPDGKQTDLTKTLEKTSLPQGDKSVTAYRFHFTPEQRGDYVFALKAPPVWMAEGEEFLRDSVKVVLHVQAQKGWDQQCGAGFELLPLTRPYGLRAGMAFQSQIHQQPPGPRSIPAPPAPLTLQPPCLVEIERYNSVAPKALPVDEQITYAAKTDPNGIVTCSLPEPGWWCITAQRNGGVRKHEGKEYPVRERATLWIYVDGK